MQPVPISESYSYERYLLALAEQEVARREQNGKRTLQQRIKAARFPVIKELADFDFSAIPKLNKAKVLQRKLQRKEVISPKQNR